MMQLSAIVGAIAIFLWCSAEQSAEQSAAQPTIANRQMMDEAVIETVLVDVLTSSDNEAKTIRREQEGEQLIFNNEYDGRVFMSALAIHRTEEKWESAKLADITAIREAGENVLDRIKHNELYAPFKPQDKRISIWKENPASTRPRDRMSTRPIRVDPPGYADANRLAVVLLSFPWSIHSGNATYLLRFDGKKWNVIARDYVFYV